MKNKIIIAIAIGLIVLAGIRVFTSCYENQHREKKVTQY